MDGRRTAGSTRIAAVGVRACGVLAAVLQLLAVPGCGGESPPDGRRFPSVLLISVDTLRADRLGCYGGEPGLSPTIDALAARGLRFDAAYAPAPFTLPSVGALMTGHYPHALGLRSNLSRLPDNVPTLAEQLRERGYATAAVVSNPVLAAHSRLDRGFAYYDDHLPGREASRDAPERVAADTTDAALRAFETLDEPFFLWVHYQDPHGPYTPPGGLRERYLDDARSARDGDRRLPRLRGWRGLGGIPAYQYLPPHHEVAWYRAGYAGEVRHVDDEIGRLLDALGRGGPLERWLVLFTADHGEGLGERDYWFAHGEYLNDAAIRVPLVIAGPGVPPGIREETVSLVDVVATVLGRLGLAAGPSAPGVDLLSPSPSSDRVVHARTTDAAASRPRQAVVSEGFKLVRERSGEAPRDVLYRLPNEEVDVSATEVERRDRLARRLDELAAERPLGSAPAFTPTDAERAALEALGYGVQDGE